MRYSWPSVITRQQNSKVYGDQLYVTINVTGNKSWNFHLSNLYNQISCFVISFVFTSEIFLHKSLLLNIFLMLHSWKIMERLSKNMKLQEDFNSTCILVYPYLIESSTPLNKSEGLLWIYLQYDVYKCMNWSLLLIKIFTKQW